MSYGDVESTTISPDGRLNHWTIARSRLLEARFIATAFTLGDYIYIAGGHNGIRRLESVEKAFIGSGGNVKTWSPLPPLSSKRSAAASAVMNNHVYIAGGMDNNDVLNSVEMAVLGPNGRLGHIAITTQ